MVTILPLEGFRQLDQLQIHFAHFRKIHVGDDDVEAGHLLDALQNVEAAAAAVAAQRIGRVGNLLQLFQHELRHHQRAVDEAGFADVGDAAVDDDAGIQDPIAALRRLRPEQARQPLGLEPLAGLPAEHEADVGQHQQNQAVKKHHARVAGVGPEQRGAEHARDEQPARAAEQRAEHVGQRRVTEPIFEINDEAGEDEGKREVQGRAAAKRPQHVGAVRHADDEQEPRNARPAHKLGPHLMPTTPRAPHPPFEHRSTPAAAACRTPADRRWPSAARSARSPSGRPRAPAAPAAECRALPRPARLRRTPPCWTRPARFRTLDATAATTPKIGRRLVHAHPPRHVDVHIVAEQMKARRASRAPPAAATAAADRCRSPCAARCQTCCC